MCGWQSQIVHITLVKLDRKSLAARNMQGRLWNVEKLWVELDNISNVQQTGRWRAEDKKNVVIGPRVAVGQAHV